MNPLALLLVPLLLGAAAPRPLTTVAERSGYARTGRYDEVQALCAAFAQAWPAQVRCQRFGTTPEGRPMLALVVSGDGVLEPAAAKAKGRPVFFFQGGIHAGEIDGKDAGFLVLRELLQQRSPLLSGVTAVFVPVFNVDGHERFGPNHRPNQAGPAEMGWRVTAQNLNLNRDYLKAEAPEMQAMLRLLQAWDPIVYADLHVTDGANFQPEVSVTLEPRLDGPPALRALGQALQDALMERLTRAGHRPLPFYPSFERDDDPASGFAAGVAPPRFSNRYWSLHHRFGVLVETHSWKDYRTRVRATADTLRALFALCAERGAAWLAAARAADDEARRGLGEVALGFEHTARSERLRFPGYAYVIEPSPVSGGLRIRYDATRPQVWDVPYYPEVRPVRTARLPTGGYVVPAAHAAWVAEKLRLHGITFMQVPAQRIALEAFRIREKHFSPEPFEGRQGVKVEGAWSREVREVPAGSLYVPAAQPAARVLAHLFEPQGPDSLLTWGFFNAALERKEYMEAYVTEAVAAERLARDPALRQAFTDRLRNDPAFARDPAARLRFFQERHPSWDDRLDLYPIYRVPRPPEGLGPGDLLIRQAGPRP